MQMIRLNSPIATQRRIYFTAVDAANLQTRLTGTLALNLTISKNGAAATTTTNNAVAVDAINQPGVHYIELTQTEVNTLGMVILRVSGTVGGVTMEPREIPVMIVGIDIFDTVRAGMTALPNADANALGGLFTRGTGAGQINQSANGMIDVNLVREGNLQPIALQTIGGNNYRRVTVDFWRGLQPNPLTGGAVPANVQRWVDTAVPAPTVNGVPDVRMATSAADAITNDTLSATAIAEIQSGLATSGQMTSVLQDTASIAGLLHKNSMLDQTTYDSSGILTSGRIRCWNDPSAIPALPGGADGADGETQRYRITATVSGGRLTSYKIVQEL